MDTVEVAPTRFSRSGGVTAAETTVTVAGSPYRLRVVADADLPRPRALGDLWLPIALLAAMRTGLPLIIRDPCSRLQRDSLATIQTILAFWHPGLQIVPVSGPVIGRAPSGRRTTALCFTGGVDSFDSLVANRADVGVLLYVHGFDLPFAPPELADEVGRRLREVAATWGCRLVEVRSNVRELVDEYANWGFIAHGPALVGTAALLGGICRRLLIPATRDYLDLRPWGSHVVLDRLWSTESIAVQHDGAERARFAKIEAIVDQPGVLDHLRVCWETTGPLNCSRCEKCQRTMTALEILGRLDSARTFEGPLDLGAVRRTRMLHGFELRFIEANLDAAVARGRSDVADALRESIEESKALPEFVP